MENNKFTSYSQEKRQDVQETGQQQALSETCSKHNYANCWKMAAQDQRWPQNMI